ncbi:MAG: hypothetical protein AAF202_12280, partial [Pseudomonadota bacterium]
AIPNGWHAGVQIKVLKIAADNSLGLSVGDVVTTLHNDVPITFPDFHILITTLGTVVKKVTLARKAWHPNWEENEYYTLMEDMREISPIGSFDDWRALVDKVSIQRAMFVTRWSRHYLEALNLRKVDVTGKVIENLKNAKVSLSPSVEETITRIGRFVELNSRYPDSGLQRESSIKAVVGSSGQLLSLLVEYDNYDSVAFVSDRNGRLSPVSSEMNELPWVEESLSLFPGLRL